MADFELKPYPEQVPDLSMACYVLATDLTSETLAGLAEDFAFEGRETFSGRMPIVISNVTELDDERRIEVRHYYAEQRTEVMLGHRIGDIVIADPLRTRSAANIGHFINYCWTKKTTPYDPSPVTLFKKRTFDCSDEQVEGILERNIEQGEPDFAMVKMLGFSVISEAEAFELAKELLHSLHFKS